MSQPEVIFEGVWKQFRRGELHDSLRDLVPALARRLLRRPAGTRDTATAPDGSGQRVPAREPDHARVGHARVNGRDEFWALQDVSFTVSRGEALGIIGANGAGKSTILKLLTGILQPTRGRCGVRGRVGALIEVAAGFHPDLTGRENIFLQGVIMGMSRAQIVRKFDEIVQFSGIGAFLDTPVKRYSSGMNARLGFAIAAHLDPDVLIVDEVLAVGDVAFQNRAFGRIRELVRRDIPVVVVSHQLDKIAELCTRTLLLERGRVAAEGAPEDCIRRYLEPLHGAPDPDAPPSTIRSISLPWGNRVRSGERILVLCEAQHPADREPGTVEPLAIRVRCSRTGGILTSFGTTTCGVALPREPARIEVDLQLNLAPGVYTLETLVWDTRADLVVENGPSAVVVVDEGPPFAGYVQLNAAMRVLAS